MPSARRVAWAKFRVAAVSSTAVIILFVLAYLLAGGTFFREKATLYVYIPDATGLSRGAPVRVDGIDVGQVKAVALSRSKEPNSTVKVTLSVARENLASIPVDSYAEISAETMIGDEFVDVTSGRSPRHIRPGGVIPLQQATVGLKSLDLRQFEVQLRSIDALLGDIEHGRNRVGQFIIGEQMYDDLSRQLDRLDRGLRSAVATTSSVGQALYTDQLYQEISTPLVELDNSLARLNSGQGGAGRFLRDPAQYEQFRSAAASLHDTIGSLRTNAFLASDARYAEWTRTLAALIQSVDSFNASPLLETPAVYDNLAGSLQSFRDGMLDFHRNPAKYLRMKIF